MHDIKIVILYVVLMALSLRMIPIHFRSPAYYILWSRNFENTWQGIWSL